LQLREIEIISGGQTGVDRAALDFAMQNGIKHGGFCPKGRKAEDGPIPPKYHLIEMESTSYPARTRRNIISSDGTLILYYHKLDTGSLLTKKLCAELNKPVMQFSLIQESDILVLNHWIDTFRIKSLNVAGPRESFSPGIYNDTIRFLNALLSVYNDKPGIAR
jgi:hypothetical protein